MSEAVIESVRMQVVFIFEADPKLGIPPFRDAVYLDVDAPEKEIAAEITDRYANFVEAVTAPVEE